MATFFLSPFASFLQLFNDIGIVLTNGLIWTYQAGTTTPTNTWTDITGVTPNSNPIQLGSNGRLNNVSIWQQQGVPIKVVFSTNAGTALSTVFGTQLGPTFDQVSGINDPTAVLSSLSDPSSGHGADLVANAVKSYDVVPTLRSAPIPNLRFGQTLIVILEGTAGPGDGGGGTFYWSPASTAVDDSFNVIQPISIPVSGRYLRFSQQTYVYKKTTTSRANTTASSADPELTAFLFPGTYMFELSLNDLTGTPGAGGLNALMEYNGTISHSAWGMLGSGTGVTNVQGVTVDTTGSTSGTQFQSAQSGQGYMTITGFVTTTSFANLSFNWAQHASNATASVVSIGSWMRVTKVA